MGEGIEILGGDYEFTLDVTGEYEGLRLGYRPVGVPVSFRTILQKQPFQACEFSLANYLMMRDRGDERMVATPVFLNRAFRHAIVLVRKDSPLRSFADLVGRRVGAREYSQTAAVWLRGMLKDDYGVDWRNITWYCAHEQRFPPPAEATVERGDEDPEDLVLAGELDAVVAVVSKDARLPRAQRRLRPLLENVEDAEIDYFRRTGLFPLNHTIVIDRALAETRPKLPLAIYRGYEAAKAKALTRKLGSTFLPRGDRIWDEVMDTFGGDPMPYGLTPINRKAVDLLIGYVHEQGLIRNRPTVDEIFAPGSAGFNS
jgi:4,5-dihydroxyphthalate decarboxylase